MNNTTPARQMADLAGIPHDDPLLNEILSRPSTAASERRAVAQLAFARLDPEAYEDWRRKVANI
ncbi:hypothetical protein [Streptomyces sp. NPDC000851]